jgi:hypothetical protein
MDLKDKISEDAKLIISLNKMIKEKDEMIRVKIKEAERLSQVNLEISKNNHEKINMDLKNKISEDAKLIISLNKMIKEKDEMIRVRIKEAERLNQVNQVISKNNQEKSNLLDDAEAKLKELGKKLTSEKVLLTKKEQELIEKEKVFEKEKKLILGQKEKLESESKLVFEKIQNIKDEIIRNENVLASIAEKEKELELKENELRIKEDKRMGNLIKEARKLDDDKAAIKKYEEIIEARRERYDALDMKLEEKRRKLFDDLLTFEKEKLSFEKNSLGMRRDAKIKV